MNLLKKIIKLKLIRILSMDLNNLKIQILITHILPIITFL